VLKRWLVHLLLCKHYRVRWMVDRASVRRPGFRRHDINCDSWIMNLWSQPLLESSFGSFDECTLSQTPADVRPTSPTSTASPHVGCYLHTMSPFIIIIINTAKADCHYAVKLDVKGRILRMSVRIGNVQSPANRNRVLLFYWYFIMFLKWNFALYLIVV